MPAANIMAPKYCDFGRQMLASGERALSNVITLFKVLQVVKFFLSKKKSI